MIFVTVGTQLPFDRLVNTVDEWARATGRQDVFAQIGPSEAPPQYINAEPFLTPEDFDRSFNDAELIIGHAGMGTIISALQRRKPILVMARRAAFKEQRNDHQLATVARFVERGWIHAADDEVHLREMLERVDELTVASAIGPAASDDLIRSLRGFVREGEQPERHEHRGRAAS